MAKKIPFFDREEEITKFREMLRNQDETRGLVIHSRGERGWGKSQLMRVFQQECDSCKSSKTISFFFDASDSSDSVVNWKLILDRTVEKLDRKRFPKYLRASASASSREMGRAESDFGSVKGQVDIADSDLSTHRGDIAGVIIKQSYYDFERTEDASLDLTEKFIVELGEIDEPIQIVWLVDSIEWMDTVTKKWLQQILGRIANRRLTRLLLIIAGRTMLDYPTSWQDVVEEMELKPFNKSDLVALLKHIGLGKNDWLCDLAADQLIQRCGGRPLEVFTQLSNQL